MAQRRRRRRPITVINFTASFSLSTLVADVVISTGVLTFGEDFFAVSVDGNWALDEGDATEGPLEVGWAHGDLSVTEIGEALDSELTDPDDIIQKERSRRPVRRAGKFPVLSTNEVLNDGTPLRTRLKYSIGDGHSLVVWARNRSGANLTGSQRITCDGKLYGRWQR